MNKELKYLILFSLMTLVSCGNEEDAVSGIVPPQAGETLQLTVSAADFVTDGAPDTRATDNGNKTTFEKDDRVGVIILDKNSHLIYDNIPYEYNNGNWTFDSNNDDGKGGCYYDTKAETYIVYYPYSRVADGVTSVDVLKTKFAPKFNQSDIKDYRSSDLMVWSRKIHLTSTITTLNAELRHAFASFHLAPTVEKFVLEDGTPYEGSYVPEVSDISDVSLTIDNTVYIPYQTKDGTLRCIVPADITPSDIRCFYTFGSKTYGNTINISGTGVVANTRYISAPAIETVPYSLFNAHVGDFYCKNSDNKGYLVPGDVVLLTDEQKTACIGVVYCVDNSFIIEKSTHKDTFTHGLVVALKDASNSTGWNNAITIASAYQNVVSVPTNSSNWYLPNDNELRYICAGSNYTIISTNGKNLLNDKFAKLGDKAQSFNFDYRSWSSKEYDYNRAYYATFDDGGVGITLKVNRIRARSSLAF